MLIDGQPHECKNIKNLTLETPRTGGAKHRLQAHECQRLTSKAKSGHSGISGRPGKPRFGVYSWIHVAHAKIET